MHSTSGKSGVLGPSQPSENLLFPFPWEMSRHGQKCLWEVPRPSGCDSAGTFGSPAEAVTPETGVEN